MDEQEKAFKEYNAQVEQEAMATIEHDIARANDPRVQKEEEERLKGILERKLKEEGLMKPLGQEVKKRKTGKNAGKTARYTPKKKNYPESPRPVRTT